MLTSLHGPFRPVVARRLSLTQLRKSQVEQSQAEILLPHPPVVKHCRRYLIYQGAVHFSEKFDLRQGGIEEHNSNLEAKQVACGVSQWK
jgi:hypothetical protein